MNKSIIINDIEYKPFDDLISNINIPQYILKYILKIIINIENVSRRKKTEFIIYNISGELYCNDKIIEEIYKTYKRLEKNYK